MNNEVIWQQTDIRQWYVDRFLTFQKTVFQSPASYFHRYASLNPGQATETANYKDAGS